MIDLIQVDSTNCNGVQSPLRSSATSLMPCFSPSVRTTSSLAETVMLLRGGTLIPDNTRGISSALLVVPTAARPLRINGDALSISKVIDELSVLLDGLGQLGSDQTIEDPLGQRIGELRSVELSVSRTSERQRELAEWAPSFRRRRRCCVTWTECLACRQPNPAGHRRPGRLGSVCRPRRSDPESFVHP